jgi:hypothetical protein
MKHSGHNAFDREAEIARQLEKQTKEELAPKNNVVEGKARMSLLPMDILRKYVVPAYEEGLIKYKRESWRLGFYTSVMIDACLRHIEEFFWKGEDYDPSAEQLGIIKHHLAGSIFCLLSILQTLETKPELDDRFTEKAVREKEDK